MTASPHSTAKYFDALMKKYDELKSKIEIEAAVTEAATGKFSLNATLLEELEWVTKEIIAYQETFVKSPYYVVPDREFTKH